MKVPTPEQELVILSNEPKICVFACAGSGKTFTITKRIGYLIQIKKIDPSSIAAITFTHLAADSLKSNIIKELQNNVDSSKIFVGTIHSFCFHLLKQLDGFELDEKRILTENQAFVLLDLMFNEWKIQDLNTEKSKAELICDLITTLGIIRMERIAPDILDFHNPLLGDIYKKYREYLNNHLLYDFSDLLVIIAERIKGEDEFLDKVIKVFNYIFIDEYQDVDPIQAEIINILSEKINICVVGDDDQSIYQFRGTDVKNLLSFSESQGCRTYFLTTNRRCPENIVRLAENNIIKVLNRKQKLMNPTNQNGFVFLRQFDNVEDEVNFIISEINKITKNKEVAYGDIAILLRSVSSYGELYLNGLKSNNIPYIVKGARNLFENQDIQKIIITLKWVGSEKHEIETLEGIFNNEVDYNKYNKLIEEHQTPAELDDSDLDSIGFSHEDKRLFKELVQLREIYFGRKFHSLLEIIHSLIEILKLFGSDKSDSAKIIISQITQIVGDYESINSRKRIPSFLNFIYSYASSSYDENQPLDTKDNSVSVITVHQAKGLEFDFVFLPMLVDKRFPSSNSKRRWLIPDEIFPSSRYLSSLSDERRLFYVACTRSKSNLYLLSSKNVGVKNEKKPSIFYEEAINFSLPQKNKPSLRKSENISGDEFLISSYSSLEYYLTCPYRYKVHKIYNLNFPTNPFFEFGKIIHYCVGLINIRSIGLKPFTEEEISTAYYQYFDKIYENANIPHYLIKKQRIRGIKAILTYLNKRNSWIEKVDKVEEPFEYIQKNYLVRGRYDMIIKNGENRYSIIDIKTGAPHDYLKTDFQMQFYAIAGLEQLELNIEQCVLYYIENDNPIVFNVDNDFLKVGKERLNFVIEGIQNNKFNATPGKMCTRCEVKNLCEFKLS